MSIQAIKCVVGGDGAVGKTMAYITGSHPGQALPADCDSYSVTEYSHHLIATKANLFVKALTHCQEMDRVQVLVMKFQMKKVMNNRTMRVLTNLIKFSHMLILSKCY